MGLIGNIRGPQGVPGPSGVGSTVLAPQSKMGASLQAALSAFPQTGPSRGGTVQLLPGYGTLERPIILPDSTRLLAAGGRGTTQLYLDPSFPHMVLNNGGTLALPAATIPVTSMSANTPTTGGIITMLSSFGIQKIFYTGIIGNSFVGCSGGIGSVTDGAIIGTFVFWLGDPIHDTSGVYGTRIENLYLDCSSTGASVSAIPGSSAVYTNRAQEFSGCYQFLARNYLHRGICVHDAVPSGQVTQDLMFQGLTLGPASTVDASCTSFELIGAGSTYRGISDATFACVGLTDSPATALYLSGSCGVFDRFNIERHAIGVMLDQAAVPNSGIVLSGIIGYGAALTDLIKINANAVHSSMSIAILGAKKISAPNAKLINDLYNGYAITDSSVGCYIIGNESSQGKRSLITDATTFPSSFAAGVATRTKGGIPSDADFAVAPPIGTLVIDTANSKLYVRTGASTWKAAALS